MCVRSRIPNFHWLPKFLSNNPCLFIAYLTFFPRKWQSIDMSFITKFIWYCGSLKLSVFNIRVVNLINVFCLLVKYSDKRSLVEKTLILVYVS